VSRHSHGLSEWLLQRLSALYLACFLLYLLLHFTIQRQHTFEQWHDWMTHPVMIIATALFILAVLVHGWVGLRDVVLDYAHAIWLRITFLSLIALTLLGCGIWALLILVQASG
jgi:succinate dehydrogenase / fumarate reductase, membrane anchor subunit